MCAQKRFEFALAGRAEDEELRALLRDIALPGDITLSFLREPSFFLAEQAGNTMSQVMICKDRQQGRIIGMGSRSIRQVYIDGAPTTVGYLSMLRGIPEARGNIVLARAYQYFQKLHAADHITPFYFTTILDDNIQAKTALTGARAGLPVYKPVARLLTYLIPLRRRGRFHKNSASVRRVERQQIPEAVRFLQDWNREYQFAPYYTPDDLLGEIPLLPRFSWQDLYIHCAHGQLNGTLGVWDQQPFKQTVVRAYSNKMRVVRPFYNMLAAVKGEPGLPHVGAPINILYAAFLSGEPDVCEALVKSVCEEWSGKGYDYLSVGVCADNKLASMLAQYATQQLSSSVYVVYWQDETAKLPRLDVPVHLEVATL